MNEKRFCEYANVSGTKVVGMFHQWGSALHYDDNDRRQVITVAIVEAEDGKVFELAPSEIKFVELENGQN